MSDYLPFDLQIEIIKRVPFEPLIKFRSVSKQWKSLIDSSKFITDYTFRPQHPQHHYLFLAYQDTYHNTQIIVIDDNDTFPQVVDPEDLTYDYMLVGSSSHGLVLYIDVERNVGRDLMAVIFNPVLEKSVDVVISDFPQPYDIITKSKSVIGFGVCPITFDPKIVKYDNSRKREPVVCEVFTLSSGVWRKIVGKLQSDLMFYYHSVVVGRFIYWFADGNDGLHMIISFDLTSEEFGEICLPDKLARGCFEELYPLNQLRGSLVTVTCKSKDEKQVFKVWMMMENRSFTKLYTIRVPDGLVNRILGFRENGQVIMEMKTEKDNNDNENDGNQPNDGNDDEQLNDGNDDNDDDQANDDNDDNDDDDDDDDDDDEESYELVAYEPCSEQIIKLRMFGRCFLNLFNSFTESLLLLDQLDDGHNSKVWRLKN